MEKALRLAGPDAYRYVAEYLHDNIWKDGFTVDGIHYCADPCSVGLTPHGQITGSSAANMIRSRGLSDLHVLDLCCGTGLVGVTMLAHLPDEAIIREMSFADINIFNITSIQKTIKTNPSLQRRRITTYLSDVLKHIPPELRFDLIVSNPPHFDFEPFTEVTLKPGTLGTFDPGWQFHREFYATCTEYLTPAGEVWFLENRRTSPEATLRQLVEETPALKLVETFDDPQDPTVFWMVMRAT
jgi:methylase of polypeptide subunit release factors